MKKKIRIIKFNKPLSENGKEGKCYLTIRKEIIEDCLKKNEFIVVEFKDKKRSKPVNPLYLLKYGKVIKKVFLYPDNPMVLVGAYFYKDK